MTHVRQLSLEDNSTIPIDYEFNIEDVIDLRVESVFFELDSE